MSAPRAAVDVGSNSVRLLVVAGDGGRLTRELTITRLAAGVDRTGHLDDAALDRTLATIGRYRDRWRALGVTDRIRVAATSAIRDAADRDRFLDGVRRVAGVEAEVLSGEEEAALSFRGAVGAVETGDGPVAVVDIGGGSTELILGRPDGTVVASVSLQLGCVRLAERHLDADPPTDAQIGAGRAFVSDRLHHAVRELAEQGVALADARTLVGVAGTATTLAALHAGLDAYEEQRIHGTRVPAHAIAVLTGRLLGMSASQRAALGPMQPGREDVIHAGALVLEAVVARSVAAEVIVSEADGLDALVASLAAGPR